MRIRPHSWIAFAATCSAFAHRQFRRSREARKYLDDLDGPIKSLLDELGLIGKGT